MIKDLVVHQESTVRKENRVSQDCLEPVMLDGKVIQVCPVIKDIVEALAALVYQA